jgi:hypothetical protein
VAVRRRGSVDHPGPSASPSTVGLSRSRRGAAPARRRGRSAEGWSPPRAAERPRPALRVGRMVG